MADRKLISKFPNADLALPESELIQHLQAAEGRYGKLSGWFNKPIYDNPIGIEIEAENFVEGTKSSIYLWRIEDDQSLKDHGVEFVSIPLYKRMIDYALYEVDHCFPNDLTFGHRTSVHVHVNMSRFTLHQLHAMVAAYGLYEECFFSKVEPIRNNNPFCYPIVGTTPVLQWWNNDEEEGDSTTKYCALNIAPIRRQMTVEFRHLQGTVNTTLLRRWIALCSKLVNFFGKLEPKTAVPFMQDVIVGQQDIAPEIWGDTVSLFPFEVRERSFNKGAYWSLALLSGVK